MTTAPLMPMAAMVFLTFTVWGMMFVRTVPLLRATGVSMDALKTRASRPSLPPKVMAANDNLMNLFEMPVLFYALCLAMAVAGVWGGLFAAGAWAFVGLRAVHSLVHCTFNNVVMRLTAYLASTLVLFGLWVGFALQPGG